MLARDRPTERFNLANGSLISHIKSICVFKDVYLIDKKRNSWLLLSFTNIHVLLLLRRCR